jgi:hypothetical protein
MEKISNIVSSKSQNAVDMSKERPVRAGAPSFGAPVSEASHTFGKEKAKEEENLSALDAVSIQKINSPDIDRQSGIVDKITFSFKGSSERKDPVEKVIGMSSLESVPQEDGSEEQTQSIDVYA